MLRTHELHHPRELLLLGDRNELLRLPLHFTKRLIGSQIWRVRNEVYKYRGAVQWITTQKVNLKYVPWRPFLSVVWPTLIWCCAWKKSLKQDSITVIMSMLNEIAWNLWLFLCDPSFILCVVSRLSAEELLFNWISCGTWSDKAIDVLHTWRGF